MKFSTIITIIASTAVGSANAGTSFLRSSVNEEPTTLPESPATCYMECLTPEGRAKKVKDLSKKKVTNSVEECFAEYCDINRSIQVVECTSKCARDFGKDVEKAVEKAIDSCEDKCEKSCSSSDEDEESGSNDDCKRDCEKECESGSLDSSTVKKAEKYINKSFASGDECLESCFPAPTPTDYETLKIA